MKTSTRTMPVLIGGRIVNITVVEVELDPGECTPLMAQAKTYAALTPAEREARVHERIATGESHPMPIGSRFD